MLPTIDHLLVNWVDGMKISREHFISTEDAIQDKIRDSLSLSLNEFNYGLLPDESGKEQSLKIDFKPEASQVIVKVLKCRVITPGGIRIELLNATNYSLLDNLEASLSISENSSKYYDIVIKADLFNRVEIGKKDIGQDPPRIPHVISKYTLGIVPTAETINYNIDQLVIGRIEVDGKNAKLFREYIPACTRIHSYKLLFSTCEELMEMVDTIESITLDIIKKSYANRKNDEVYWLVQQIAFSIAQSKDCLRMILVEKPPIYIVEFFMKLARLVRLILLSFSNKEEFLQKYCNWMGITPYDFEESINELLISKYNHQNISQSLEKIQKFTRVIITLLSKVKELQSPYTETSNIKPPYGWLVIPKEGKFIEITNKTISIGKSSKIVPVDLAIRGDVEMGVKHAVINIETRLDNLIYILKDLNTGMKTYIHNTQQQLMNNSAEIKNGYRIQLGNTSIIIITKDNARNEQEARIVYSSL